MDKFGLAKSYTFHPATLTHKTLMVHPLHHNHIVIQYLVGFQKINVLQIHILSFQ